MTHTPSENQLAIFNHIAEPTSGGAIIKAVAGSGKTTTILAALEYIPPSKTVAFLAFNKDIAAKLKGKVPPNVHASTFHSLGFAALRKLGGNLKVEQWKVGNILRDLLETTPVEPRDADSRYLYELYSKFVKSLVSLAKGAMGIGCIEPDEPMIWRTMVDLHELWVDEDEGATTEDGIKLAQLCLKRSLADQTLIDFDDMLYMPLVRKAPFSQYDFVFVDEAQDTNAIQRTILTKSLKSGGRLISVGDEAQSIYGFRGADSNAMRLLQERFSLKTLPLSVSYRCSKAIVREAQKYTDGKIEPREDAPEGLVEHLPNYNVARFAHYPQQNSERAILCRNTAPLVSFAFSLIKRGLGCRILGRDIGENLTALVKKHSGTAGDACLSIADMLTLLLAWSQREIDKLNDKGFHNQANNLAEKIECVQIIAENVGTHEPIFKLHLAISDLFKEDENSSMITLCTIHRSKGLEWETVFLLDAPKLMPSRHAKQPWQKQQETNLHYVAVTRAKLNLFYINSESWKS